MGFPRIVCPDNEAVLQRFTGHSVALRVNHGRRLSAGVENVRQSGNRLFCVIVESDRPLAEMDLADRHQGIPLAVMVPAAGRFRDLAKQLDRLRRLNLRVYLPCDNPDNLTSLRILASVGIHCGADFRYGRIDWESLADLATYAVLEQAPHATIEPFEFIASNYQAAKPLDWGRVCFDDPRHFLHLDEAGRVALSRAELTEQRFVAQSLAEIGAPAEFPPIRERLRSWRHYFSNNHPCASCAGWRLCLGKFSADRTENPGCADFFVEMIDLVRQRLDLMVALGERRIWQL
ncbi:MAG: hypothetical protein NTW80_05030 [Deltaproteobacteria bacterium]|nr:hypothetical protein [Deltaproteobacteria bacterium]